jgi:hypothetical protein
VNWRCRLPTTGASGLDLRCIRDSARCRRRGNRVLRFDTEGKYLRQRRSLLPGAEGLAHRQRYDCLDAHYIGNQDGYTSNDSGNIWTPPTSSSTKPSLRASPKPPRRQGEGAKLLTIQTGKLPCDPLRGQALLCVHISCAVCRSSSSGSISWSHDAINWSEPIAFGDPNVQVTGTRAAEVILVLTEDSFWAVDPNGDPAPWCTASIASRLQ